MPTLYTSCPESLEVQIKITTACISKTAKVHQVNFLFPFQQLQLYQFQLTNSVVQVSDQKTRKTKVLPHFHILFVAFISFFSKHFCNMLTCNIFFFNYFPPFSLASCNVPHVLDIIHDALQCLVVDFIFIKLPFKNYFQSFLLFFQGGENSTSNFLHLANMMKLSFSLL